MKMKFIISGILIAAIGLVLSHTYRPYIYENHINDYHLADVIGSIVCVPAAVLCVYGIDNRYSIKQYTIGAAVVYIAYEFLGLFHIHGTFDVYDIIAIIISSLVFLSDMLVIWSFKRQIDGKFRELSFCAVDEYSSLMCLYHLVNKVQAQSEA